MMTLAAILVTAAIQEPRVVCAEQTSFELAQGEQLKKAAHGIHQGTAEIETPRGRLIIIDGHSWVEPRQFEEELVLRSGVRIMLSRGRDGAPRYAVFGKLDSREWGGEISSKPRLVAWVEGTALRGSQMDNSMLERIRTVPLERKNCIYNLDYGWDQILPDEPGN